MIEAPAPPDEEARMEALRRLGLLDAPPSERFDRITRTGQRALGVPITLVTLVDTNRQWFASCLGLDVGETPRGISFCAHAILRPEPLVIPDALADERFADNPLVTGPPFIRFYAGIPLHSTDGHAVGTFCAIDTVPRAEGGIDLTVLQDLATWAEHELNSDELARALQDRWLSERRLAAVLDAVADGIATFDGAGRIRTLNPSAERMFGISAAEAAGRDITSFLADTPDAVAALTRTVTSASGGQPPLHHLTGRRAGGQPFPIEVTVSTAETPDGRIGVAAVRDLSERHAARAAFAGLQLQYDVVLAAAAEGIAVVDRDGRITHLNPAAARLLGEADGQALIGRSLHDGFHGDAHPAAACAPLVAMAQCRPERGEAVLVRPGGEVAVEQSAAPLVIDGVVTGAVVTLVDITERIAVQRLKDEFVSVVSHELRTPLTSIRGSLGLLANGVLGEIPGEAGHMVGVALSSTERLIRLVNDILDMERLRSGHSPTRPSTVALPEVLEEAVVGVRPLAEEAGITVAVHAADVAVVADRDRLVQAVTNLAGNAVKFSPPSTTVTVDGAVDPHTGELVISVSDQGRGIPAADLDRMFEPFQQLDSSDARKHGGTGLGLAIVRTIAEAHGGRVEAASEVGAGSTFTLRLPQPAGA